MTKPSAPSHASRPHRIGPDLLESLLDSMHDVVYSMSLDGTELRFLSRAAEEVYGRRLEAFTENPQLALEVVHHEDRDRVLAALNDLLAGVPFDQTYRIVRPDGTERWLRDRARVIRAQDGTPVRIDGIATDVTTEHEVRDQARLATLRAELATILTRRASLDALLQQAAESLVRNLDVASFRIWTLDEPTGVLVLLASAGTCTHRDGSHDRVPLGTLKIGHVAAQRTPHITNDVLADPEMSDGEWAQREGMVAFAGYPLVVADRLVGVMATFARRALSADVLRDLGAVAGIIAQCIERARAEEALRASEAKLRTVIDNAQHGLWDWETAADRVYWDDRRLAILGYGPGEVPASHRFWTQTIHPDDRERVLAVLQQHLDAVSHLYDVDYRAQTKSGDWIWVNSRGRVYERDADGRPLRMMGTIHDISARKAAEAEHQQLEAQVQKVQRMEGLVALAGGVAHNFSNLLMAILGNATLAHDALPSGSPAADRLRAIEHAATRATELTQCMLAYTGKAMQASQVFRLDELITEMTPSLRPMLSKAVLGLTLDAAPVRGDRAQIRQVVASLVANAAESLRGESGEIHVRTGVQDLSPEAPDERASAPVPETLPAGRYSYLEVVDTGVGIAASQVERIFDPFFTTKFIGRGLGLAAVQGIVRAHGGVIVVTSKVGAGSTFRVLLPTTTA